MKVINRKYLPARLPVVQTAVLWLLFDRLHAPGWVQGACWTVLAIGWIGFLISLVTDDYSDPAFRGD